jgi:hypothetical protein
MADDQQNGGADYYWDGIDGVHRCLKSEKELVSNTKGY